MTASAQVPTLDDYFAEMELRDIALSPDGKTLAGIRRIGDNVYRLMVYDLDNKTSLIASIDESKGDHFMNVQWLSNRRMGITVIGSLKERTGTIAYRRMVAMDANGANILHLLSDQSGVQDNLDLGTVASMLSSDPDHILMSAIDRVGSLYRVNINTGASKRIAKGIAATIAFGVSDRGEDKLSVIRMDFNRPARKISIFALSPENNKWQRILSYRPSELEDELAKGVASFQSDTTMLVLHRLEQDEYIKLHRYDIKKEVYTDVAHEIDGHDIHRTIQDRHTGMVIGVTYIDDRPHNVYFNDETQRVQSYLERMFPNGIVDIRFISTDERRYLFFTDEPWHPGSYGLFDKKTNHISHIADLAPKLKRTRTSVHQISYAAKDTTKTSGYLTRVEGTKKNKLPLIVFPHGGPHARDWVTFNPIIQYFASRGYAVFQPNFRGSQGYGHSFEKAGYQEYGANMIDDIELGVRALIEAELVDPQAICAAGMSYGGYAALMLDIRSELLKCVVSINAPVDWELRVKRKLKQISGKEDKDELRTWFDEKIGNIDTQEEMLLEQSALHRAGEIKAPVLLIHAHDDDNVDIRHGKKMNKALKKAGKKVTFVKLRRGGHSLTRDDALKSAILEADAFISQHIR